MKNGRANRPKPNGDPDVYEKRTSTPDRVWRKWGNADIYDVYGASDPNRYRIIINKYGDIGWIDAHNYDRVIPYRPKG